MALWKPFLGNRASLENVEKHAGYVYWCADDGSLHFDYTDADGNLQRKQINAKDAETLTGVSLDELKKSISWNDLTDKPFETRFMTQFFIPRQIFWNAPTFDFGSALGFNYPVVFYKLSEDIDWYTHEVITGLVAHSKSQDGADEYTELEDITDLVAETGYTGINLYQISKYLVTVTPDGYTEDYLQYGFYLARIEDCDLGVPDGLYIACYSWRRSPQMAQDFFKNAVNDDELIISQAQIIPIDERYIPDTIARTADIPSTEGLATEKYVDDAIANIDLPGGGGGGSAIIDVVELPTENINEKAFYRVLTGTFVYNQYAQNGFTCYCVDGLPASGEPATNATMSVIVAYYNTQDGALYGYVDGLLSQFFGVPIGWYPAEMLFQAANVPYSGIITNLLDDPRDNKYLLLLENVLWSYKDGEWTSHKTIGWAGQGKGAEVFNLPSNKAYGSASHAEGRETVAGVEGENTYGQHAEGRGTKALGEASHAEGYETTASGHYSHAQGKYNIEDTENKYAHIVGNGNSLKRSNAHTLDWDGNAWFQGEVFIGGTGQDDETAKKLATTEYVDEKVANTSGGGGGSGGDAIVDVLELPTEGINTRCFYRLKTAYLVFNQYDQRVNNYHCICVSSLPEVGKPVTTTMLDMLVYYSLADDEAYGYITDELGAVAGVPAGWYTLSVLAPVFNVFWKGIITDINDDPCDDSFRLLVTQEYYVYQDGWCKIPFAYERPPEYDIQWDGDMTDRIALDMSLLGFPNTYFVKVSDDVFTTDDVIGWRYTGLASDGGIFEGEISPSMIDLETYPGIINIESCIAILYDADTFSSALGIPSGIYTNGVYFWLHTENGYISSFTSPAKTTKIDGKYVEIDEHRIIEIVNNNDTFHRVAYSGNYDDLWNRPSVIRYDIYENIHSGYKQNVRNTIDVYSKAEVDSKIANAIGSAIGGSY